MQKALGAFVLLIGGTTLLAKQAPDDRIARGKQLFDYHCASCHGPGVGNPGNDFRPGTNALRIKYGGSLPPLLAERTDLTRETVAYFVRNGVSVMAPYRNTEISDADLAAIGAYISRKKR